MPPTQNYNLRRRVRKVGGAFGMRSRKNPMHGIACASPRKKCEERHIEGARDTRPTHPTYYRDQALRSIFDRSIVLPTHRDTNPHPVAFLP